jgi:hypothetical protein
VIRYDETVHVSDGGLIAIDFTLVPLVEGGQVTALVSSAIDVTERQLADTRTRAMAVFTRRLAAASNVRQIVSLVAESGPGVLNAATCRVALWDQDRGVLLVPDHESAHDRAGDSNLHLATHAPGGDAVHTRTTIVVADTAAGHEYPHLIATWADTATLAMAAVPLQTAPGTSLGGVPDVHGDVLGILDVTWTSPVTLDPAHVASLNTMADICGQALHRAVLHDAQGALVQALQHELLPGMPMVSGLHLAARYLPASDQLAFGGDWYDAIPLSPTITAVVVGDVVGHGVHAAARMARVRGVLDALIHLDADPCTLFRRAHRLLLSLDDPFIGTAAVFLIDTADNMLTYARAGHPPALLLCFTPPPGGC